MKVAFGMKAHSGWTAMVVLGRRDGELEVVDRRRVELVEEEWAKQPYHAAGTLESDAARDLVERGVRAARRIAARALRASLKSEGLRGNQVVACAVLVGDPMPVWSVDEILAVHFRMHRAEGFLFRDALARAARANRLKLAEIPEKLLSKRAESALGAPASRLTRTIAKLGKSVGPPWGRDEKDAALAALIALEGSGDGGVNAPGASRKGHR